MSQNFNQVRVGNSARSTFNLSHRQVTTSDFGYLIPICVRDLCPNDDVTLNPRIFARMAPAAFPFYGKVTARIHSFFVPYRILFPKWSDWLTQSSSNQEIPPYFTVGNLRTVLATDPQFGDITSQIKRGTFGRVLANFGINPNIFMSFDDPTNVAALPDTERISAFRSLAYYRIWMDWFMDSNIYDHSAMVSSFNANLANGGSLTGQFLFDILRVRNACFGKDYFTTAKLHPQAGNTPSRVAVDIADSTLNPGMAASSIQYVRKLGDKVGATTSASLPSGSTSTIGQFTVEDLRAATSLQRYLERNNYVGSKVINQLLAHFGIAPSPERLDMSEFLGGSNLPLVVADVTSTTPNQIEASGPQTVGLGAQAGKGWFKGASETVSYHAKEHGVFMTLMSIIPDTAYYQGIPKVMQLGVTGDPLDYYTPEFENLGFQEILNKEVYVPDPDTAQLYQSYDPDGIFGYAPRYAFLKWQNDILAGDFVGSLGSSDSAVMGADMDAWHLFRKFSYDEQSPLALNSNFVECINANNSFDRVFQITNNDLDHFYFSIECDFKSTRNMVGFVEPSLDTTNSQDGNTISLPYGGTRL